MRYPRRRARRLIAVLTALGTATSWGCIGWQTSADLEIARSGGPLPATDWSQKRLWVRSFEHTAITEICSVYVAGYGGSASGIGVTHGTSDVVPRFLLRALERNGTFESLSVTLEVGRKPDLILEGESDVDVRMPWWTWLQFLDLAVHAWFFPTLGRSWTSFGELVLYDVDRKPIQTWEFRNEEHYVGTLWWGIGHNGGEGTGFGVERSEETVKAVLKRLHEDLNAAP